MARNIIINADDFGLTTGVNRGIIECHRNGIVTSTSMMVTGHAVEEAVELSRKNPDLSIGLHWDVWGEDEREFDIRDIPAVRDEFYRQIDEFLRLFGRMPTHVDSHRHAHFEDHIIAFFQELVAPLGLPLRGDGQVRFVGGFYAQWEWKVTNLENISVAFLSKMLREEVREGWTEFSCHPGYVSTAESAWVYGKEREEEIRTLTNAAISDLIEELDINLTSYANFVST